MFEFDDNDNDDDIYISPHLYEISFKNCENKFQFILLNYSNGYYDGWIEANVIE